MTLLKPYDKKICDVDITGSLKFSMFNVFIKKENNINILFNTCSSAVARIDDALCAFIDRTEIFCLGQKKISDDITKSLHLMIDQGFIVNENFDELEYVKHFIFQPQNPDHTYIVIAPTTFCNMQCPYCFESGFIDCAHMDRQKQEQVVDFVKSNYSDKNISVVWYGGEPLLNIKAIEYISTELIEFTNGQSTNYNAGMITNGYLLTPNISDRLKSLHVRLLQVTLDGFQVSHDKRRKLKTGDATFWRIINNLDYAQDLFNISLRLNVDSRNIKGVQEILEWIRTHRKQWFIGKNKIVPYVAPITCVHRDMDYEYALDRCEFSNIFREFYMDYFFESFKTALLEESEEYFFNQYCALERKAWRGVFPFSLTDSCGVLNENLIVIGAEGNLYKCWDTVGVEKHSIGSITNGILKNERYQTWQNYFLPQKCEQCVYLPICLGGCIRECIDKNGEPSCPYDFSLYKEVVYKYINQINTDN